MAFSIVLYGTISIPVGRFVVVISNALLVPTWQMSKRATAHTVRFVLIAVLLAFPVVKFWGHLQIFSGARVVPRLLFEKAYFVNPDWVLHSDQNH